MPSIMPVFLPVGQKKSSSNDTRPASHLKTEITIVSQILKIRRPDDWHVHLRDGDMLQAVLPYTSAVFRRAIIMPNLISPIKTVREAVEYKNRILNALPSGHSFLPLMTCYLTDDFPVKELTSGFEQGIFTAAKLYPAHATTNSSKGVSDIPALYPLFEQMQKLGMPLLVHGEVASQQVDIFDREAIFIEQVLEPLRKHFPALKIVFEHVTTKEAVNYVKEGGRFLGATITPQHLLFHRNDMLAGGIRPHLFCLPILKRSEHQKALRDAVSSGHPRFFLGTDSAPHTQKNKESACGCAGVFNAVSAVPIYASIFEEMNALEHLEAFCSLNGAHFYGLPENQDFIELIKVPFIQPKEILIGKESLIPFLAGEQINWSIKK